MNFLIRTISVLLIVTGINPLFIFTGLVVLAGTILFSLITNIKL